MRRPRISLVIPAFNEERYIGRTLNSVMKARENFKNPSLIEVIAVDNGSTDDTAKIARGFGAKVVFEKERCIASARNKGAQLTAGEIVGFLDADSVITPNMFNSIDMVMSTGGYIGGGTLIKMDRYSLGIVCTFCITVMPARWLFGIMGGLLFADRRAFDELGGFDESLYCAEDTKLAYELKRLGRKTGKKFKVLTKDYVITSTRAFDKHGDWYYFKNIPAILSRGGIRAFRERDFCWKFWYDVRG